MPKGKRSRAWCFTLHIHDQDGEQVSRERWELEKDNFTPLTTQIPDTAYCIYQYEIGGKAEHLHIQGYVRFANARTLTGVKRIIDKWSGEKGVHLEIAKGNALENKEYCTKSDTKVIEHVEFGLCPVGDDKPDMTLAWQIFYEAGGKVTKKLVEEYLTYATMYSKKWKEMYEELKYEDWNQRVLFEPPEVIVLWGATGTGKTRRALDDGAMKIQANLRWPFNEYRGQKVVVFDDYRGEFGIGYFLQLIDGHPMTVPLMYVGNKPWIPNKIYITSNKHPKDWYPKLDAESYNAMTRRFSEVVYFPKPVVPRVDVEDIAAETLKMLGNAEPCDETLDDLL